MPADQNDRPTDPNERHETPFRLGDPVVDREQVAEADAGERDADDVGVALVVRAGRKRAEDVPLGDGQKTVADVNAEYPPGDPVVEVVFTTTLDGTVPAWRENWSRAELASELREYTAEWGVPISVYSYPASRLVRAAEAGVDEHAALEVTE